MYKEQGTYICKLCLKANATKTGSHILPFSLIRGALNFESSKERGKELIFKISSNSNTPEVYIGQSVLPEKIEELENELKNTKQIDSNLATEDFIFCPICENRLAILEGYFSENVINFLLKDTTIFKDDKIPYKINKAMPNLIRLYTYSLFWRLSISTKNKNFKLKEKEERKLRALLDSCLDINLEKLIKNSNEKSAIINAKPITILYNELHGESTENPIFIDPIAKSPYMLFANRFVFILYFKESHIRSVETSMYGISKHIRKENLINLYEKEFTIGKIHKPIWEKIITNLCEYLATAKLDNDCLAFSLGFEKNFGERPPKITIQYYRSLIAQYGLDINDIQINQAITEAVMMTYIQNPELRL